MPEEYKLAYRGGTGEIVEKKSRFIADVMPVSSEDEALLILKRNTGMPDITALHM